MTELGPFRALRYDPARAELGRVLVPPYDVVAPHERDLFYERDPHNAIRLELTRRVEEESETDYAEVSRTLEAWQSEGVLRRDASRALYALRQDFEMPDGGASSRDGFFALLRLEDYDARVVRPHERTLSGPKADRLKVMRAAEANLSPVFFLYEDPDGALDGALSTAIDRGDGVSGEDAAGIRNHLVPIEDRSFHEQVRAFFMGRSVVIADGHHRYETALAFRRERPELPGAQFLLGYFVNAYAPGTSLLPIHRVLLAAPPPDWRERLLRGSGSGPRWHATRVPSPRGLDLSEIPTWLKTHLGVRADDYAFAADDGSEHGWVFHRARDGDSTLSIRVIHDEVLGAAFGFDAARVREGAVAFPKSAGETARMIRAGEGHLALYLNPLTPREVFAVTAAGEVLPQKSTFFFPKLPTGLVFRPMDEGLR